MKQNKSEIVIVLDRSGSMASIKNDMQNGLKSFLDKQKLEAGECTITCYQFDSEIDRILEDVDIKLISSISLDPRGSTRLFDAIGTAVDEVGKRLSAKPESERPEKVFVLVITDGEENSSHLYNNERVKEMIKLQEEKYSWKFIYLGANQDAFLTGQKYGFSGQTSMKYSTSSVGIQNTFDTLSRGVSVMRCDHDGLAASYSFSEEERKMAVAE
jgi:uncharacterized protein YegL